MVTINAPGGFVPRQAMSFGEEGGPATAISSANPLPVVETWSQSAATSAVVAGTISATGATTAFLPVLRRPIWLILTGGWAGSVVLQRSIDDGGSWNPLTYGDGSARPAWTGNMQAVVAEESVAGARYRLSITLTSGTLGYRMEQ